MPAGEMLHLLVFDAVKKAAFCSCPFFPKPCLHALALIRLAEQPELFPETTALPDWAEALPAGRPVLSRDLHSNQEQRTVAVQKRRFERLERAANGMDDLEAWLLDTLRRGLATAVSEDPNFSEGIAARAADASLSGVSRRLRLLATLPANQPDWAERALAVLADTYLAVRAFQERDALPPALLHDLQTYLGFSAKKEDALSSADHASDTWAVVGRREEPVENQLTVRRSWLLGGRSGRYALLLDYAFGLVGALPPGFAPGDLVAGTLAYYPSAFPQRVQALDDLKTLPQKVGKLPGYPDLRSFADAWAAALGVQPWLALFPAAFPAVTPAVQDGQFFLVDAAGDSLPVMGLAADGWKLLALSGGHPVAVFGEWDGSGFRVLSVVADGRIVEL